MDTHLLKSHLRSLIEKTVLTSTSISKIYPLIVIEVWRLAFGVWRLAFGVWRLAFGVWRLAFGRNFIYRFTGEPYE